MSTPNYEVHPSAAGQLSHQHSTLPRLSPLQAAWLIACLVFLAYLPSLNGKFIFDDDVLLTNSPYIASPNGLYLFWFTTEPADYYPVFNTSLWIEWRLWGPNPSGYHFTNVLLHIASALLIWAILRKLLVPGAFLAALLFAVHPVNVEAVAWISQRKELLAMVFFLFSILWYLTADEHAASIAVPSNALATGRPSTDKKWYWLSLFAFVLAMLSKGSPAIVPIVLLGLAWWQRRRITRFDLLRVAPFLLVAIVLTLVNIWSQNRMLDEPIRSGFVERLARAGAVVWFYLSKALLPINLVFIYPRWHIEIRSVLWWLPLVAALAVSALLIWQLRKPSNWSRPLLFAWGLFCVGLLPVMGFADVVFMTFSLVADHYQHIAIIAVVALVAAGWRMWHNQASDAARRVPLATAAAVIVLLTYLTWQQNRLYSDPITLYQATLEKNPACWAVRNNLAGAFNQVGRSEEAIEQYQEAVRLHPNYPEAFNNCGIVLGRLGRLPEAIAQFQQAVKLNPSDAEAHSNLGLALFKVDQPQEAIDHFETALRLQPKMAIAHAGLAQVYAQMQRSTEAIAAAQQALELARSQGQTAIESQISAWLDNYLTQQAKARDGHD